MNWCDSDGKSLALSSAQAGHVTSLEFLIGHGADLEAANKEYDTPLHCAIYRCVYERRETLTMWAQRLWGTIVLKVLE